ncbi:hypothetical protein [Hydrogenophaga laconesensis]|uniref:Uncharacterized protein n=1 Tax=Hydrogenophaga laconesensis TaxID=1805971 RepID=A0ABU1V9J5_9BURK|nr:hypothetical protein [Hydrogenophaga laconesensis]MDR7094151.1 hypothetical protein [Hydrogenophaga laconesensis]
MSVTLIRAYGGSAAGQTLELSQELEAALIAQGLASAATANTSSSGAQTQNTYGGMATIPIGASSVVITNSLVNANSVVMAVVSQAAADGTLLRVERVVPAAGSFTIYGTAAATAATVVTWAIQSPPTGTPAP